MNKQQYFFMFLFFLLLRQVDAKTDIIPTYLRIEYKENPFTDVKKPRLSWELTSNTRNQFQSAYQVLVVTSPDLLNNNNIADLWDLGMILSKETNQIIYEGKPINSGEKVWWKVRAWDREGKVGEWSEKSTWETGLSIEDWKASWIGYDLNQFRKGEEYHLPPVPYMRKELDLKPNIKCSCCDWFRRL